MRIEDARSCPLLAPPRRGGRAGGARAAPTTVRLVTHADVDDDDVERVIAALEVGAMIEAATPERALAVFAHPDDPEVGVRRHAGPLGGGRVRGPPRDREPRGEGQLRPRPPTPTRSPTQPCRGGGAGRRGAAAWPASSTSATPTGRSTTTPCCARASSRSSAACRPDALVAPDPTAIFFGDSYVNHRDHRQLGWAVLDTLVPAASPLYVPEAGAGPPGRARAAVRLPRRGRLGRHRRGARHQGGGGRLPREPTRRRPCTGRGAARAPRGRGGRSGPASCTPRPSPACGSGS